MRVLLSVRNEESRKTLRRDDAFLIQDVYEASEIIEARQIRDILLMVIDHINESENEWKVLIVDEDDKVIE